MTREKRTALNAELCNQLDELVRANDEIERLNRKHRYRINELETMLDVVPLGLVICEDSRGDRIRTNQVAARLYGISDGTTFSVNSKARGPHRYFRFVRDGVELPVQDFPIPRVLRTGETLTREHLQIVRRDGSASEVLVSASPLFDENGRVRGAIAAMADITEERLLGEARSRLAAIVDSSADAIIAKSLDGTITSWNGAAERMYGYRAEEAIGSSISMLFPPERIGDLEGILERIRRREPVHCLETERVCKDGTRLQVSLTISPLVNTEGRITGASVIARDITARKRAESDLRESQRQLVLAETAEKLRRSEHLISVGTMAAGIAHEINNPVNSILMNAERALLVLGRGQLPGEEAKLREILEGIVEDAKRCGTVTRSVLRLSGKEKMPKISTDMNGVIRSAVQLVDSFLKLNSCNVDLDLESDLPLIRMDSTSMEQAFVNLLCNAAESTDEPVEVRIRSRRVGSRVVIDVVDDGQGIPEGHLNRIFDPFFSTRREGGGTGLGLSLVHRIVTDHGGAIDVESSPYGTEFRLRFPASTS